MLARALVVVLALASLTGASTRAREAAPVVVPRTRVTDTRSSSCGTCHADAYTAWETSAHHRSHTDPLFARELHTAVEPAWCTGCHAPDAARLDEGVGCAVCHVQDGVVRNPTISGRAPHASVVAAIDATETCASCHQFHFSPASRAAIDPALWLQDTVGEHAESPFARRTCTSCHMPSGDDDPHALPGHRDPGLLAHALTVQPSARRVRGGTEVTLRIRGDVVGHAVPTGDLLRELVVRAWPAGHPDAARATTLGRRLTLVEGERVDAIPDTRVSSTGTREVILTLRGHPTRVSWDITLTALPPGHERARGLPEAMLRWPVTSGETDVSAVGAGGGVHRP